MRSTLCAAAATLLFTVGCGPEYPDDEYHQDVTDQDCRQCHVLRSPLDPNLNVADISMAPDDHWDGDDVSSAYEECQGCHDMR